MIILNLSPFWAGLLGLCIMKEKVSMLDLMCMFVAFAGIVGIAVTQEESGGGRRNQMFLGIIMAFAASWFIAFSLIIIRKIT